MRKLYKVSFYYETDLRRFIHVYASNEVSALVLAFEPVNEEKWVDDIGFRIEITLVK